MLHQLNLTRTSAAVDAVDRLWAAINRALDAELWREADALLFSLPSVEAAVGEAFALDTADRNQRSTALTVRDGKWLRWQLAQWKAGLAASHAKLEPMRVVQAT